MESPAIKILQEHFSLASSDINILNKNSKELIRNERRYYFQNLKPKENEYKEYIKSALDSYSSEKKELIQNSLVGNLLQQKGEPSIADGFLMDAFGRLEIYRQLREKSESEGIRLNALTNFGGISMVIILVGIITAIVLYFFAQY